MAQIPTILIIIGITGDLSKRKLLPAIEQIVRAKAAPHDFKVIGITRQKLSVKEVLADVEGSTDFLAEHLDMYQVDLSERSEYERLKYYLAQLEAKLGPESQRLFYLSVPPQVSQPIVELLGASGLAETGNTKLLLEKPFGVDLSSAEDLIIQTKKHFAETQIYRIDHYLAKEMSQNLIVFRESNSIFKRTWHREFIEQIEIIASERLGIEGRAAFYEQTGALRDVVQSHLLQLAALVLMETPGNGSLHKVPAQRLAALKQLRVAADKPISDSAKRGQYKKYRDEVGNPSTTVETYVSLALTSVDPRWLGVPIKLVTGKCLKEKLTQIKITYKKDQHHESNELMIMLQPNEGVELLLWTKVPGYEHKLEHRSLKLAFKDYFPILPEAYEQVFLDAINSNHTLFTSSAEVLESWRIIEPIQKSWAMSDDDLVFYNAGTSSDSIR